MISAATILLWLAAEPLALIPEGRARIFSEKPGGAIVARPVRGKGAVTLHDGEEVRLEFGGGGVGDGEAVAEIVVGKRKLRLPNAQVMTEEDLVRSPDRQWAVWIVTRECGDACHGDGWLLGPGMRRKFFDDVDAETVVAWRPDGAEVAVGSNGTLFLFSLPNGDAQRVSEFEAPAYAADGRLFVRGGAGDSDAVYEWVRGGKPRRVLSAPGRQPPLEEGEYVRAITVPTIEGGRLFAKFLRKNGEIVRSVALDQAGKDPGQEEAPQAPPPAVERALAAIVDDGVAPGAAAVRATEEARANPAFAHQLASAANTRGFRLYQGGKRADALPLFEAAAALDARYGMPRYNAARVLAERGDTAGCARWLGELKALGSGQRRRLEQVRKDPSFAKVIGSAEVRAALDGAK